MSNRKLGVEVVRAYDLMPKDAQGTSSASVEIHFDNQTFQTTTKERDVNPVWDESFHFNISDPSQLPRLTLEAKVYHHKKPNSKTLLGMICLPGKTFLQNPDDVSLHYYPLRKNGFFSHVKGELGLRVFVTKADSEAASEAEPEIESPTDDPKSSPSDLLPKETSPHLGGGQIVRGRLVRGDRPTIGTYDLVEAVHYLFVRVVKAQFDLHSNSRSVNPYVEVKIGNYKGITKPSEKKQNPEWNVVFAFARHNLQSSVMDVVVKEKDILVKDDFVGSVKIPLHEAPMLPADCPLSPTQYQLSDNDDKKKKGELELAVWYGTQADKAFSDAWHSDTVLPAAYVPMIHSKVYHSPKLWYVRVYVIEAQNLVVSDNCRSPDTYAKVWIGDQCSKTKTVQSGTPNSLWNEELVFIAAEPFDGYLKVSVEDRIDADRDETLGRVDIPLNSVNRLAEDQSTRGQWFNLENSMSNSMGKHKDDRFSSRIHLHFCLDGGYNVPSNPIGILEVGILDAKGIPPMKTTMDGNATTDSYCVAKYGHEWFRTRTIIDNLNPKYNEQHTWKVYDPATVLTVGIFGNNQIGNSNGNKKDVEIGKVQIQIYTLESDRVYTYYYPLVSLCPSGVRKMGELHIAIRFSCKSLVNLMFNYCQPRLQDMSCEQAVLLVADRFGEAEPPLGKEVVQCMYSDNFDVWSMRRSKANFFRVMAVIYFFIPVVKWVEEVCMWENPITTGLVHVMFVMLVCTPQLILPTVFLYMFVIGIWNFRYRPRDPPHWDTRLSHLDSAHPDELDEEFDTSPSSRSADIIRMRYDRLRSIAGRVQTVGGDIAAQGERIQNLITWRDPRVTAIFLTFCLVAAMVLYATPFQVLVIPAGLYFMRHPIFRGRKIPSALANFWRRLPDRGDCLF